MSGLKSAVLQGLYLAGGPAILRRLPAKSSKITVLAYHSVSDDPRYALPGIRVTPALFAKQIKHLKTHYAIVDLADAIAMMRAGDPLPDRAVAITFDDGYADNYTEAFPVLREAGATATIFVTVDPVLDDARFWVSWLYETLVAQVDIDAIRAVFDISVTPDIEQAFNAMSKILNYCSAEKRHALLDEYARRAKIKDIPQRVVNEAQMREMQRNGVRMGSHTLTHPILANLDPAERQRELRMSRERLSSALDQPVDLIAYPNGRSIPHNFDDDVIADCVDAGYLGAVTSKRGPVTDQHNLHALPRMGVAQDGGMARFAVTLERYRIESKAKAAGAGA